MNDQMWAKIETIVDKALHLPKEEQKKFIDEKCKESKELKTEVTTLLDSITESEGWLENPQEYKDEFLEEITEDVNRLNTSQSLVGKQIGSYQIKEQIGEGGMGSVYLAERSDGEFEHQVAIKIIRAEKASQENIRRFEQERTIMAGLSHPGIAKLFDGGISQDGSPYFIMEYVDGIPIDQYCQVHDCSIAERIQICKQVLQALRHAHENLIVHRDLKPGNILVNTSGQVKILDFGISKLLKEDQDTTTQTGARLLTPKYASPEQILETNITTATDIYSMGVILYLLLSESLPFDFDNLSHFEIEQTILETTPAPPSSKVGSAKLRKVLNGDLDAIVLKAMRKESDQRYRTANDFLDDLKKYQKGLLVEAREDSVHYRTQKFFSRHKQATATTAGIIFLIIGFIGFYTWQITKERNEAQTEAEKAQEVTQFVVNLLKQNHPENSQGKDITVRQVLDESIAQIEELEKSASIKGKLLQVIGHAYRSMGKPEKAQGILQKAIAVFEAEQIQNLDLARTYDVYGIIARDLGDYDKAETYLQSSADLFRDLKSFEDPRYTKALKNLAYIKRLQSDYGEAQKLIEEALALEKQHTESPNVNIAETLYITASIYRYQGKYEQAIEKQRASLEMLKEIIDGPHPGIVSNLSNIAVLYNIQDKLDQSKKYYQEALKMAEELYEPTHPEIALISSNLSDIYLEEATYDSAKTLIVKSLKLTREKFGENHPRMATYLDSYAKFFSQQQQFQKADSIYQEALHILYNVYEKNHPQIASFISNRAHIALQEKEFDDSVELYRKALRIKKENFNMDHPTVQKSLKDLSSLLYKLKRNNEADSLQKLIVTTTK